MFLCWTVLARFLVLSQYSRRFSKFISTNKAFWTGCKTKQDVIFGLAGQYRSFHQSAILMFSSVIPFILADIGKGITEVQIIQW
jgi:hypothetical protein